MKTCTRRPQLERRPSLLACGLPALATPLFPPARARAERHHAAAVVYAGASSLPSLIVSCPWASSAQTLPIPPLFLCRAHPEHRTPPPPPSSTPATLCSPLAITVRLPLPTTTPWGAPPHPTDTPRPLLVVGFSSEPPRRRYLLAGEFLFPSSPSLRPFSIQSNHPSSFLSSCCS
jgi:hypothetical protein